MLIVSECCIAVVLVVSRLIVFLLTFTFTALHDCHHYSFSLLKAVGYPFDLIKTRIQASPDSSVSIWETAMQLRQEPGGLYRGFGLKLVRAIPASMIGFTVYEFVKEKMIGSG